METYILPVLQFVEVRVQVGAGRAAAISALKSHPPMRILNGAGFQIKTRDEIEIIETNGGDDEEMPEMP